MLELVFALATGAPSPGEVDPASLRLGLLAQMQLHGGTEPVAAELRRLRPTLEGTLLSGHLRAVLQLSVAPGALELVDLYADLRFDDAWSLRAGQHKIPFSALRRTSAAQQVVVDFPVIARHFGSERQIGATLELDLGAPRFRAGLFSGQNARAAHAVRLSTDLYAIYLESPSDLASGLSTRPLRGPELAAAFTFGSPGLDASTFRGRSADVPPRFLFNLGLAWDFEPRPGVDHQGRAVVEGTAVLGRWTLHLGGYASSLDTSGGPVLGALGAVAQASLRVGERGWVGGSAAWIGYSEQARADARALGRGPEAGDFESETELLGSLGVSVFDEVLEAVLDAGWVRRELARGARDELRVRAQIQFRFPDFEVLGARSTGRPVDAATLVEPGSLAAS